MNEDNEIAALAESLWKNYIKQKTEEIAGNDLSYYIASVVSNNGDGTVRIKAPYDNERTADATQEMGDVTPGTQVMVMRFGDTNNAANHLVIANASDAEPMLNVSSGGSGTVEYTFSGDEVTERTASEVAYGSSAVVIEYNAFAGFTNIQVAAFPKCSYVASYAFNGASALKCVYLPKCQTIDTRAFGSCYVLTDISIPKCENIMNGVFGSCSILSRISLPACKQISDYAFENCTSLSEINFRGLSSVPTLASTALYRTMYSQSTALMFATILIPSSLYSSFVVATNWVSVSDYMVSI